MANMQIDLFEYSLKTKNAQEARKTGYQVNTEIVDGTQPFNEMLLESIKGVNKLQKESDGLIQRLATGDVDDISEVVMASSRAEIAMKLLMEVRNKLLEAYQQISRIQG